MKRLSVKLVGFIVAFSVVLLTSCSFGTGAALTTASIPTNSPAPSATIIFEKTAGPTLDWSAISLRPYDDGAEVITIPGGTFTMGNSHDTAPLDQKPAHEVTVGSFQIYNHEVTNKMYQACVESGVCMYPGLAGTDTMRQFFDPAYNDYPVVGVDWHMARQYCEFVGGRLPTEAEWELAARGLDSFTYPWGESLPTCDLLNMKSCYGHSVPGGSYPEGKSPFGLYDVAGNVWEWVNDWYAEDGYATAGIYGPTAGEEKVLRGGDTRRSRNR